LVTKSSRLGARGAKWLQKKWVQENAYRKMRCGRGNGPHRFKVVTPLET
jgi:hypothetical protein